MPKGVYERTKEHKQKLRIHWAKEISDYNKSEAGRERARKQRIAFNKSELGREKQREGCRKGGRIGGKITGKTTGAKALAVWAKSEAGRETARKNFIIYNKSEKHREAARRGITKTRALNPTQSQKDLSNALTDIGIYNYMEHYFPEIRRIGDIAIPSAKLIIEVDGSSHNNRMFFKSLEEKQADDKLKEEQILSLGWNVIRVTNEEVKNDMKEVICLIKKISLL